MIRRTFILAALTVILGANFAVAGKPAAKAEKQFQVAPDKAFDTLKRLEASSGLKLGIQSDEASLFVEARTGKLGKWNFAEACLIASGVTDAEKRKSYMKQIDEIETGARKAIDGAKTPQEKGEKLLKFLTTGAMSKGDSSHQTDLHTILDDKKFNCVSSAVLYNVIGRRLGMELRAVEIPGHVYSILVLGDKTIRVETTNAAGFNLDKSPKGKSEKSGDNHREIGELGLAAVIAYNHGVDLAREHKHHEAILANFRAMSLDPSNRAAADNALAGFANWGIELAKAGKFEEALNVAAVGLDLAPSHPALTNNQKVFWNDYAKAKMAAGKSAEA